MDICSPEKNLVARGNAKGFLYSTISRTFKKKEQKTEILWVYIC